MQRTSALSILSLGVLLLGPVAGCVRKSDHEATLRELETARADEAKTSKALADTRAQLSQRDTKLTELEDALAVLQQRADEFAAERGRLQGALDEAAQRSAALEGQVAQSERELADLVKRRANLKASLDRLTAALSDVASRELEAEKRVAEYRDMLVRFRALIDAGTLDVRIVGGRMVLTLPVDILFASGSTRLSSAGELALGKVGAVLAAIGDRRFQVEGHTDDVPIRTERFASNWELASGRALVVVHALVAAGVRPEQLSAASFAEYQPRASNGDEDGRAKNRRIEITVVPDLSGLPGNDELERVAKDR